jgi:FKBP-type peptidyl-prolyl cis-trans isomerase FkpA
MAPSLLKEPHMTSAFARHALLGLTAVLAITTAHAADQTEKLPGGATITHTVVGKGAQPTVNSTVTVQYKGTLQSTGVVFDSSYARNQPLTFALNQVIPCWQAAIPKMKIGGKAHLVCPAATAYGSAGAGNVIPPNATLLFDVELLDVKG